MAKVKAIHTIHRAGKRKGEQEVLTPGTEFESTGQELEGLKARGAVTVLEDDKPAKARKTTKASTTKADDTAGEDGDDLGEL